MFDGKRVALPFNLSTPTLFYNASLFQQAGLDPARPPHTWAEVQADALQIHQRTGADGVYVANSGAFDWLTQSIVNSNGGYTVRQDGKKVQIGFDQRPAMEALQMLQRLHASGAMPDYGTSGSVSSTPDLEAFVTGHLGMYLQSTVAIPALLSGAGGKFQVDSAPEPSFGSQPAHPVNSGAGLVAFSQDRARQQADWTFMRYLTSHAAYEVVAKQMGYLPLRSDVVDDPSIVAATPLLKPTLQQLPHLSPWVPWPGRQAAQAMTDFQDAVQSVEFQGAPAAPTMRSAAAQVKPLLTPAP